MSRLLYYLYILKFTTKEKQMNITIANAVQMVETYDNNKIFSVTFVKRTDGTVRTMNCRKGVKKYTKGGSLAYDPKSKNLLCVWDAQAEDPAKAYRMISTDAIKSIKMEGKTYIVTA